MKMRKRRIWLRVLGILAAAGLLCYLGLVGFVVIREKNVPREADELGGDYDAIIILGAQVLPSGEPNTQLQWRLDKALEAWNIHPVPMVVCGAQGRDEPTTEARAMKQYLMKMGVAENWVYLEEKSFNTNQNLTNAGQILKTMPDVRKVVIVTSDYHVPRAMALAGDMGFEARGLGSPCKPEYWIKNHAREALSWVKYWLVKYLRLRI